MIKSNWTEVIEHIQNKGCSNFAQCHPFAHLNFHEFADQICNRPVTQSYVGILLSGDYPSILVKHHGRDEIVEIPMIRNAEISRIGDAFLIVADIAYVFKAG